MFYFLTFFQLYDTGWGQIVATNAAVNHNSYWLVASAMAGGQGRTSQARSVRFRKISFQQMAAAELAQIKAFKIKILRTYVFPYLQK